MYTPENLKRWTMPECYYGATWNEYYSSSFGQHRDSDCLERSNFQVALRELGGESETVKVVHERHWAVGWVEWIAIHESDERALQIADRLAGEYEDYPILDENHHTELETEEADKVWKNCYSWSDRIKYIRDHKSQFEFHDYADMIGCVRGHYFAGYTSELLY